MRAYVLLAVLAAILTAVLLTWMPVHAQSADPLILVFTKTDGYRHASIPDGIALLRELGEAHGFRIDATEDATRFNDRVLSQYTAVVFLSTTGDVLNEKHQGSFERYIRTGGGYLGIHAASDTEYEWPWYGGLVGAYFDSHPETQSADVIVEDDTHPSTTMLPRRWTRTDEWYNFRESPRGDVHVLLTLNEDTYEGGTHGGDHPIAWCHLYDGGRAWYTGGGHTAASYEEPLFQRHVLGGVRWALGDAAHECAAEAGD